MTTDFRALTERLDGIQEQLSERNVMTYSDKSIAPDKRTRAMLDLVDVISSIVEHLQELDSAAEK